MREIKLSPLPQSELRRLTIDGAIIHLYACAKDEFALTERGSWKSLYAFESKALTKYLEKKIGKIHGVSLHECYCKIGNLKRMVLELRLKLSNGSIVTINDWEKVYKTYELRESSRHAETLYSPYSAWELVPEEPYVFMFLTGRLVDFIDLISAEGQQKHLLTILWKEFEMARSTRKPSEQITVQSEFMEFQATQLNTQLIKFDLCK
jgi:hypothetical protein